MRTLVCLLTFLSGVWAVPSWQEEIAVRDSLRYLPPNMRFREMHRLGLCERSAVPPAADSGLQLLGKWGGGPSEKVTGRDSIVFLSRGSEVVAISFADTANPEVLSYTQVNGLVSRSVLVGDRLYVGSTGSDPKYIDVFNVADPANPVRLGSVQTLLNDIAVQDTLVYAIADDSLKVFNFADPENPWLVGACRDSGYDISVCNGYAYLGDRWGLYVVDVRDPATPQRVASWGTFIVSVQARDSICCVTQSDINNNLTFRVLDTRQPSAIVPLGMLADQGGYDMFLDDSLVFLSGAFIGSGYEFQILSIADSLQPRLIGAASTLGDNWGVWVSSGENRAFVADRNEGMQVFDIANLGNPARDTTLLAAGSSYDVDARGNLMVVANEWCGMKVLGIAQPVHPVELAAVDTTYSYPVTHAVLLADSFAYAGWYPWPYFRAVGVRDSTRPEMAGACAGVNTAPEDMVLRDSLVYIAGMRRFNVVNVARPREPELVGSCNTQNGVYFGLAVQDSFAYLMSGRLQIINIARPDAPVIVSSTSLGGASGIAVRDTFAYIPNAWDSVRVYSVADPAVPRRLSAAPCGVWPWDVALGESTLYVATSDGWGVDVYDLANPGQPVRTGRASAPTDIRRLHYCNGHLYAAMWEAGVAIYETTTTEISEPSLGAEVGHTFAVRPNPTRGLLAIQIGSARQQPGVLFIRDMAGRLVNERRLEPKEGSVALDIRSKPAGIYVIEYRTLAGILRGKIVKQ